MVKDIIKRWGPVFIWAGLIFGLSSMPTLPKVGFLWWDFAAKKSAHMLEYAMLMYLLIRARLPWSKALMLGIAYAVSDEIHQSFVLGRTSKLTDVGFDTMGMLLSLQLIKLGWRKIHMTYSPKQTQKLAGMILQMAAAYGINVISVKGEMGAGKTTLIQGVGKSLGISKNLQSPTFILVRSYEIKSGPWSKLYHVDLYRLEGVSEIKSTDLAELWSDPKSLVVIEWAERAEAILPPRRLELIIDTQGDKNRQIKFYAT